MGLRDHALVADREGSTVSNPRREDRLVAVGPAVAARPGPPGDGGLDIARRGMNHPVLAEVLRQLLERDRQTAEPVGYYEDSP